MKSKSKRQLAVGCSAWLDLVRGMGLWLHATLESRLASRSWKSRCLELRILCLKLGYAMLVFRHFLRFLFIRLKLFAHGYDVPANFRWSSAIRDEFVDHLQVFNDAHRSNENSAPKICN